MAGGTLDTRVSARAASYEYKITRYLIFSCVVGAVGGSLFGYDLGVSGTYINIHMFYHTIIDNNNVF